MRLRSCGASSYDLGTQMCLNLEAPIFHIHSDCLLSFFVFDFVWLCLVLEEISLLSLGVRHAVFLVLALEHL